MSKAVEMIGTYLILIVVAAWSIGTIWLSIAEDRERSRR